MPYADTEDHFAEPPASGLFAELGCAVGQAWRQLPQSVFTEKLLTADYADYTDKQ